MFDALHQKKLGVRIILGVVVGMLGIGMLLYLIPGQGSSNVLPQDTVAEVAGQPISVVEVQRQLGRLEAGRGIPAVLRPYYAQQVLNQLVFKQLLELEAKRLGIRVTPEEQRDRILQLVPDALSLDKERYAAAVQNGFNLSVPEFEELIRTSILQEKIQRLVTDGVTVAPEEVQEEFRRRNEKVKVEYALIQPAQLESKVEVADSDLAAFFEKNKSRYNVPERRVVRYALLDLGQLRQRVSVTDEELRAYYNGNIERYRVENRVHVFRILFKTVGKTDAEIEEIRKKAEDVLKQARRGAKFEELARKYSEDAVSKDKGGDLAWIGPDQALPEFSKAAFNLPNGAISDLVRTQLGFDIINLAGHEIARTKSLEEVRAQILPVIAAEKAERQASEQANTIATEVHKSTRGSLDEIAKKFNLTLGETRPIASAEPVLELGNAPELRDTIFRLRQNDLGGPIRTDRGYVVLTVKEIQPAHPGTLAEVHDRVANEYRREKAGELAKSRAEELTKRGQSSEGLVAAAKAMGFESKTSEALPRDGTISGVGSMRPLAAAFSMPVGQTSAPVSLGANWIVYRVVEREEIKQEDFDKQRKTLEQEVLQNKRKLAYDAFSTALEDSMRQQGQLRIHADVLKRLTRPS